jgi:hypothetical protein
MSYTNIQNTDFLNQQNEAMLNRLVYGDFMRRTNGNINDKQKDRLMRTVHHYMEEVYSTNPRGNVQAMNKEVLKAVVSDFNSYLNRGAISATSDTDTRMKEDIGSRFSALQNERTEQKALMPPVPDFRIPIEDSNDLPALSLFEQAKKNREVEARREELENSKRDDSFSGTFLKDLVQESFSGLATANPTTAKPEAIRIRPALPQDTIIPQDEILSFKENEYNLVIYSADRDWYNNQRENRYNFSVTFNPANNGQGFKMSPSANMRFHNIVRIEMVKAIVPNESVNTLITNTGTGSSPTYGTTTNLNILSEPGIILHVDELESNVFGTDDQLDRAFASLQYDAQWISDTSTNNPGYLAMIPKFLKCQKVYYPTPLATLTKMTIQLQRPNGSLVSDSLDTLDISGIFASTSFSGYTSSSIYMNAAVRDTNSNATFYTIVTKTYFSRFAFSKNDRIRIQNINTNLISGNVTAKSDFDSYMENKDGLLIVSTGYTAGTVFTDGVNNVGYCNFIVVQAPYRDPTTGSVLISPFGGTNATNQALATAIANVNLTGARLINLSKQTQLTFRIITRDMDSATRIRPNNA